MGDLGHRLLFEASEDGMLLVGAKERIVDANTSACRLLGRSRGELVGLGFGEVLDPCYPLLEAAREKAGNEVFKGGVRLVRADGTLFPTEVSLVEDVDGTLGLIFSDTSSRRSATDAAREVEQRFTALVENGLDLITLCDPDNTIRYISPSIRRILGYEPEELIGSFVPSLLHPDDLEFAARESHKMLTTPNYGPVPIRYRRKDGFYVYLENIFNNMTGDPVVRGIVANSRDVTDRVMAEQALKESEERFRALVENAQDLISVSDRDNTLRYVSPAVEKVLGYRPEELVGVFVPELLHPEELEAAAREVERINASSGPIGPLVYRYRHRNGSYVYLESIFTNLLEDPAVRGVVANSRDITERVRQEEALDASESRLRLAVQATGLGTWDFDLATGELTWDGRCKAMFGLPPDASVDYGTFIRGVYPADRERVGRLAERAMAGELGGEFAVEYRTVGIEDGVERWVAARGRAFFGESAVPYRFVGTVLDITERKRVEEEIRRLNEGLEKQVEARTQQLRASMEEAEDAAEMHRLSEERFRSLVRHSSDIITVVEADGRIRYESPAIETVLGYTTDELVGKDAFDYVHPEDIQELAGTASRLLEEPASRLTTQFRFLHKDGSWRSLEAVATNLLGVPGVDGVVINSRDITARLETERELRQSEELYRAVVEQAAENIFLVDLATKRILQANAAFHDSLGYPEEEIEGLTLYDIVEMEGAEIDRSVERIARGERFSGERRYRRKDGSLMQVEVSASAIGYGGEVVLCIVAHDVTERKKAEEGLRHSLGVLLALYEASQVLTSTLDMDDRGERLLKITRRVGGLRAAVISLPDEAAGRSEGGRPMPWKTTGPRELWCAVRESPEAASAQEAALNEGRVRTFRIEHSGSEQFSLGTLTVGVCLPLRTRGRAIGLLEVFGEQGLTRKETLDALGSLADQAGNALENARLYEELHEREERLRELVGQLFSAQEEERKRVAYDVHDGLTQIAVAVHNLLQAFAADHPHGSTLEEGELDMILNLAQQTVTEARRVIADLRPTILDDFGLAAAIRHQVSQLKAEPREVYYTETLGDNRLPQEIEIALFRIAQEALTNVRKHAGKDTPVYVSLARQAGKTHLQVRDCGRGFDPHQMKGGGTPGERVGLSSMQERITLLGGDLTVESSPGEGTTVIAEVPLPEGQTPEAPDGE